MEPPYFEYLLISNDGLGSQAKLPFSFCSHNSHPVTGKVPGSAESADLINPGQEVPTSGPITHCPVSGKPNE